LPIDHRPFVLLIKSPFFSQFLSENFVDVQDDTRIESCIVDLSSIQWPTEPVASLEAFVERDPEEMLRNNCQAEPFCVERAPR
jgi:hypothetical protein